MLASVRTRDSPCADQVFICALLNMEMKSLSTKAFNVEIFLLAACLSYTKIAISWCLFSGEIISIDLSTCHV